MLISPTTSSLLYAITKMSDISWICAKRYKPFSFNVTHYKLKQKLSWFIAHTAVYLPRDFYDLLHSSKLCKKHAFIQVVLSSQTCVYPRKLSCYRSDQHDPDKQNPAEVRLEMERVKKWLKMLRSWDSSATKEKLRKRVYKGVPNSLRGQVWSKMLNLPTVREEQSGKYQVGFCYIFHDSGILLQHTQTLKAIKTSQ